MVAEDGSVVSLKPEAAAAPADVLQTIDQALAPEKPVEKPPEATVIAPVAPVAAPAPAPAVPVAPAAAPARAKAHCFPPKPHPPHRRHSNLKTVADPEPPPPVTTRRPSCAPHHGRGYGDGYAQAHDENMARYNLPQIVERIVEREVRKLTK